MNELKPNSSDTGDYLKKAKKVVSKVVLFLSVSGPVLFFALIVLIGIAVTIALSSSILSTVDFFSSDDSYANMDEKGNQIVFDMSDPKQREQKCLEVFNIEDPTSYEGKTTLQYCDKLYEVTMEYKDEYEVSINPMLITATLFYGRTYDEYKSDSCEEDGTDSSHGCEDVETVNESNFASWFSDPEYNKKATKYIRTLAGYMIIQTETNGSCGTPPVSKVNADTPKELATAPFDSDSGGVKRIATYVVPTVGDGSEVGSCPYEDDTSKFEAAFRRDGTYRELMTEDPPKSGKYKLASCPYVQKASHKKTIYEYDDCAALPYHSVEYSTDYSYEGVYYYRLMAPMKAYFLWVFPYDTDHSFISKYYDYIITDDSDQPIEENEKEIVDGIYMLYETIMGSEYADFTQLGLDIEYSYGGYGDNVSYPDSYMNTDGDWVTWSQKHNPWAGFRLGVGAGTTIYEIGCATTALAKIIAMSGADSSFIGEQPFNPGTFAEAMRNNGGYTLGGDRDGEINWDVVQRVVPSFQYVGRFEFDDGAAGLSAAKNYVSQGYFVVIKVIKYQHWVAATGLQNNELYISDTVNTKGPETIKPFSQSSYSGVYGIRVYRKV